MRLGLNQPYFFPYIGHFALIRAVDTYIVDDVVQYIQKGWMSRNRILKQSGGIQYIILPAQKHDFSAPIRDVRIDNSQPWQQKILGQMAHYKKAPYYQQVIALVKEAFACPCETVSEFNTKATRMVCSYLGIDTPIHVLSEMNLEKYRPPYPKGENALHVCLAVDGVTEYWNAPGGAAFYDREKYRQAGIEIRFQKMILDEYPQKGQPFEAGLSILDVMMFNDPQTIQRMMDHYEFI